ncbi:hypothetical protein ACP70R_036605 [Stipagrostis hirtigluma subsp. patula]
MPAQKRPLPSPASEDSDGRVASVGQGQAAAIRGGGGVEDEGSRGTNGDASARRDRAGTREPRGGDPDDDEEGGGGGGDGSDSDSGSSLSAGSMDE